MVPDSFKDYYLNLNSSDQQRVVSTLLGLCKTNEQIKDLSNKAIVCPHCGDTHIVDNGKSKKGVQPYLCRCCNTISSSTTGQVWYRIAQEAEVISLYALFVKRF